MGADEEMPGPCLLASRPGSSTTERTTASILGAAGAPWPLLTVILRTPDVFATRRTAAVDDRHPARSRRIHACRIGPLCRRARPAAGVGLPGPRLRISPNSGFDRGGSCDFAQDDGCSAQAGRPRPDRRSSARRARHAFGRGNGLGRGGPGDFTQGGGHGRQRRQLLAGRVGLNADTGRPSSLSRCQTFSLYGYSRESGADPYGEFSASLSG
jgi:hypothetical protein